MTDLRARGLGPGLQGLQGLFSPEHREINTPSSDPKEPLYLLQPRNFHMVKNGID